MSPMVRGADDTSGPGHVRVLACGALAGDLEAVLKASGWDHVSVEYLPAELHDTPERIAPRVDACLARLAADGVPAFVAYADCGTRGALDEVLSRHGVPRLPGAHCYEVFAGTAVFDALMAEEPGTFFLTDFLVRNFDRLVFEGLGLDRTPQLRDAYFGNYRRMVWLAQADDPELQPAAERHAHRIGLPLEVRHTGREGLAAVLREPWDS